MEALIGFVFGVAIGFVLERGQFCMASAFRDFFLFRHTQILRAVMLYLALLTPAFFLFNRMGLIETYPYIKEAGLFTVMGGIIFGIGMVLAGGCASGTLYRIGEGYVTSMVALLGMLVGIGAFGESYILVKKVLMDTTSIGKLTLAQAVDISQGTAVLLGTISFFAIYLWMKKSFRK
ncbi:YeeE/YedE thiosulfate transporter family protein [Candidatus Pyrohabitans sp.]